MSGSASIHGGGSFPVSEAAMKAYDQRQLAAYDLEMQRKGFVHTGNGNYEAAADVPALRDASLPPDFRTGGDRRE